ncbi:ATP-dependent DNA helicase RecG [Synechocystis sp. LKSZ1]|uniref:ATP-dependent DNA helicase RecG n=1 Tax=Synechocystis sp. LKSZ1 TaxID=3144951 RepID=UPI00336BDE70
MTDLASPDWLRLQKALALEAERGFLDLQGHRHRFSEFLVLSLQVGPPPEAPTEACQRWQDLFQRFQQYPHLSLAHRQSLVAQTRRFLQDLRQTLEAPAPPPTKTLALQAPAVYDLALTTPLIQVKEIGQHRAKLLALLGLRTVRDVLFYFPRDHIDYAKQVAIVDLVPGETVTLIGRVIRSNCFTSPKNRNLNIFEVQIRDATGRIKLNRFYAGQRFANKGWQERMKKLYAPGVVIAASGLVKANKYGLTLDTPEIEILDSSNAPIESLKVGRVLPVYPLTEGVTADMVRWTVLTCLGALPQLTDPLPSELQEKYELIDLPTAIANIHFPENREDLEPARRRLIFDEFFYLQLGFLHRRYQQKQTEQSVVLTPQGELMERFHGILPFQLTQAQQRVVQEILQDLTAPAPMNRLVQGDVGSGKTVVGVFAILAAIQSGYQAALMAPTEVLAEQHYRKLVGWFNLLYLPVELLTGSTKTAKRRQIHQQLVTGELPLLVGTHALIQDAVNFNRLGLVVIDEQHRFGVQQRARLLAKGQTPHVLTMTATPIPRTLALTLHGDLEVSQIDELPPGRQPITTMVLTSKERLQAYDLIRREVAQGRQVYIIFPVIEESEKLDVKAAVEEYQRLSAVVFPDFRLGLLHGRMAAADKDAALTAFREQQTQIIVSTTVIEVGVDVPNATVMLIENAERFGLSQLHQLRGRVGRGSHRSYCLLMTNSKTPDSRQRLAVLEQSQDGFFIAEMDLRLRGPGEVLGTRQSGLPDLALASLAEDQAVLFLAREAAEHLMQRDSELQAWPELRAELTARHQRLMGREILT